MIILKNLFSPGQCQVNLLVTIHLDIYKYLSTSKLNLFLFH